jgi:hypothetical protein
MPKKVSSVINNQKFDEDGNFLGFVNSPSKVLPSQFNLDEPVIIKPKTTPKPKPAKTKSEIK